jgi:hypothetical protein
MRRGRREARRRAAAVAALALSLALTAACGDRAVVGVDDSGRPLPSLVAAGHRYAVLVTADDRSGLAAMAGPGNVGARLDRVLAAYAGHPVRVTGYEGDDANTASVRFAVRCDASHTARFGQGFAYAHARWHPVFRDFPPLSGTPTARPPRPGHSAPWPPLCPSA